MRPLTNELLDRLGIPGEFPDSFFPKSVEEFRRMIARSANAPDDFAVAHLLVGTATVIGKNVRARVQGTWTVSANLLVAVVGNKGSGKSTLSHEAFAPLLAHEASLMQQSKAAIEVEDVGEDIDDDDDDDDDEDEYDTGCGWVGPFASRSDDEDDIEASCSVKDRNKKAGRGPDSADPPEISPVIANDVTGPGIIKLLEANPRQLLVHTDELASLFIRNTGGTDRQLICELADGRRRRQTRATRRRPERVIEAPHLCLLGGLTPPLLRTAYGSRGDDGFLDRFLLLGTGESTRPAWPDDVHDPQIARLWTDMIGRLLMIETEALDASDGKLEVLFDEEAIDRFRGCVEQMNLIADAISMAESQRGVINKMKGFLPKLALIRRAMRWAQGEFGSNGPIGDIDAADADESCKAVLFFFGRWVSWRPELSAGLATQGEPVGLASDAGDDPALQLLERQASAAQTTVRLVERVVRYLRTVGERSTVAGMLDRGPMVTVRRECLLEACNWLVENGHARWDADGETIVLEPLPAKTRKRRRPIPGAVPDEKSGP